MQNMKIKETKILQEKRLNDICVSKGVDYDSHQQKINDIIEKATK